MAVSLKKSPSEEWRLLGNEKYAAAHVEGINPNLKRDRLSEALNQYYKAYNTADSESEKASAAKNLGLSNWKIAPLQQQTGANLAQIQYFYKEALTYLDKAKLFGELGLKDFQWQAQVFDHLITCWDEAIELNVGRAYRERIGYFEQYINCLRETSFKAECYLKLGMMVFHEGITAIQAGDYKTGLSCMKECYRPVEEARRLADGDESVESDVFVLETDCLLNMCTAESIQALEIGDHLLNEVLNDEEILNMGGVYDAMDWYRRAIILTREKEVEKEAIAYSRLGVIYDKIIKRKDKAHDYFKQSIDLASALSPRNFATAEWFQKATEALQRYQEEQVLQESEEWAKNRVKYVEELKEEINALNNAIEEGIQHYLKYIYKEFPPKKKGHKLKDEDKIDSLSRKELQGVLKKALVHYHPDKQKEHGEKWVVMCEEIMKILTREYEGYKCVD